MYGTWAAIGWISFMNWSPTRLYERERENQMRMSSSVICDSTWFASISTNRRNTRYQENLVSIESYRKRNRPRGEWLRKNPIELHVANVLNSVHWPHPSLHRQQRIFDSLPVSFEMKTWHSNPRPHRHDKLNNHRGIRAIRWDSTYYNSYLRLDSSEQFDTCTKHGVHCSHRQMWKHWHWHLNSMSHSEDRTGQNCHSLTAECSTSLPFRSRHL